LQKQKAELFSEVLHCGDSGCQSNIAISLLEQAVGIILQGTVKPTQTCRSCLSECDLYYQWQQIWIQVADIIFEKLEKGKAIRGEKER
jgi:hypothetical protein